MTRPVERDQCAGLITAVVVYLNTELKGLLSVFASVDYIVDMRGLSIIENNLIHNRYTDISIDRPTPND